MITPIPAVNCGSACRAGHQPITREIPAVTSLFQFSNPQPRNHSIRVAIPQKMLPDMLSRNGTKPIRSAIAAKTTRIVPHTHPTLLFLFSSIFLFFLHYLFHLRTLTRFQILLRLLDGHDLSRIGSDDLVFCI